MVKLMPLPDSFSHAVESRVVKYRRSLQMN